MYSSGTAPTAARLRPSSGVLQRSGQSSLGGKPPGNPESNGQSYLGSNEDGNPRS